MSAAIRTIGFVGLGTMGGPMARNLLKAGFALRAFDVASSALAALAEAGATPARSAADAANGVDALVTMLPNGSHVEDALLGPDGAASALAAGALLIEMSTIAPGVTDRLARAMSERGIAMVDAPVGRSSQHAVEGKLLIMAGGGDEDVERARPVLEKLGDTIVHCGPVGSGARMKIVNNFMSITLNATTSEALSLAEASGLDPELARSVMLGTVAGQGHLGTTYPAKVLRGDLAPGFAVDLAEKDLGLALELGESLGLELATGRAARGAYVRAQRDGRGRQDWTALYAAARDALVKEAV
ncbi:MAG TPA: sulfolactaldehyde 3-reductase [Candidatus Baltobacteraceae bacterium]|nr:sulfolactaldehyde 3-reductase [Candidatus Baltobacteraceae bacterium]